MGERSQGADKQESLDDVFEPALGELLDEDLETLEPISRDKQKLAAKRRRAELRLEEKRLRDELGYYDLELDDL